jgi:putative DNA primase/helicase
MSTNDPFTREEAQRTASNRARYTRYAPPKAPPKNRQNGHRPEANYAWNDQGNAARLLDAGGRERLLYVLKRTFPWNYWDGTCWPEDRTNYVGRWLEQVLHDAYADNWQSGQARVVQTDIAKFLLQSLNTAKVAAALAAVARQVTTTREQFDTHDWLLPCANGQTYDLSTGRVIPSLPEHYMTRAVPVDALTKPAKHPKYDHYLRLLFGDNNDLIAYVEWIIGLSATGYTGEKSFWFWQGDTNAGKTTLLTFIAWLLGAYVYNIPLKALLKMRQDTGILHDIAETEGMRFVYAEEFRPGDVLDSSCVKRLTGQGNITADRKGEPDITFPSKAKLVIGTNTMPILADVDTALRGRVRVVPFPHNVLKLLEAQGVKHAPSMTEVIDGLKEEGAAILYDLVQRVAEWEQGGRVTAEPQVVAAASKQYLDAQDLLVDWLDVCFEHAPDGALTTVKIELPLLTWYWSFLEQSGHTNTKALYQGFGAMLTSKGFDKRRTPKGWNFIGPALTVEARRIAQDAVDSARDEEERRRARRGY